ncbi:hypothetical protein M0802_016475 [Mischocyttarus mexicanus]|nr:hypothetical protein M0802_016475 [Mischocyttarus mexicanus]
MGFLQGGMLQLPSNGRHRPNSKRIRMPSLGYAPAWKSAEPFAAVLLHPARRKLLSSEFRRPQFGGGGGGGEREKEREEAHWAR